jgi:hypothetical protein
LSVSLRLDGFVRPPTTAVVDGAATGSGTDEVGDTGRTAAVLDEEEEEVVVVVAAAAESSLDRL